MPRHLDQRSSFWNLFRVAVWLCAAMVVGLAVAFAVYRLPGLFGPVSPSGVEVETVAAGQGKSPTSEDVVLINYKGMLADGKVFDEGKQVPMAVDGVITGFAQALKQMQRGGKYKVLIPSELGYGNEATGPIPANSDLTFEVELLDFKSKAEIEQQRRLLQQDQSLQQQQGRAQGAAGQISQGASPPEMPPQQ